MSVAATWCRSQSLNTSDQLALFTVLQAVERGKIASIGEFAALDESQELAANTYMDALAELMGKPTRQTAEPEENGHPDGKRIYQRNPAIMGPMHAFGYSYIEDHLPGDDYTRLALSGAAAYEALNLVNGQRSISEIRDWLSAEFAAGSGPVALEAVTAYLAALEQIDVLR